ncbi:MAG: ABC transporter ATP-binding protein [Chloroflexota bacterium]
MQHSNGARAPIVRGDDLHKVYLLRNTRVDALRGVDVAIDAGEFVAIMGPSGCGKSTLLNLLAGLDEPTRGQVVVAGASLNELNEGQRAQLRRQKVGFVFQSYDLLPLLTVLQNVEFPLAVAGVDASTRRTRALEMLAGVGLSDKGDSMVEELSGGQKQRVAIARTLVTHPDVIFADEPTGSLDTVTGNEILSLLRRAADDRGTTVVMVTHDAQDARVADRVIYLRDGIVLEEQAA